ncbi:MAG: trypsin-like peptidase domain-containing protein, partial [Chthoniobacteraceae bacterium]
MKIASSSYSRVGLRAVWTAMVWLGFLLTARAQEPGEPLSLLHQLDRGFTALFERVAPTVVVIEATREITEEDLDERSLELLLRDEAESPDSKSAHPPFHHRSSRSEGSGFFVGQDGFVVTNLHVIDEADELTVRTQDRRRFPAKVIGRDEQTDIAVLKVEIDAPAVAKFGDSDAVRIGQLVGAIGAPFNQDYSFTCGWVSGTGRTNLLGPNSEKLLLEDYIQTDAFINPGNSGGPLFDVDGRVIGMNTLINGLGRGLAFAIPSNLVRDVVDQLVATGKVRRSWLGIRMGAVEDSGAIEGHLPDIDHGVVVYTIVADSPAYQSEL